MMVKPWTQVVKPHADVLKGELTEALFAADLEDVRQKRAPSDYQYARPFFEKTYQTGGLVNLLANVLRRLAGQGGDPVINLQTPFGGGKTHALIALYHLCASREEAQASALVSRALEQAGLKEVPPARVVVFVGTAHGPQDRTPWGLLAEQLGCYEAVVENDRTRTAPGTERLHRVLGEEPVIILMDEVAEYGVKARGFRDQVMAFLQELTQTVKAKARAVLVATLPSSAPYGEEGARVLHQLEMIFGRTEAQYELVRGEEIYEVVRVRLFRDLGPASEREHAVHACWEMYQGMAENVPQEVRQPRYRDRMLKAYPFHPEVIDILFERWSTLPTFQRTRGVLRFLAEVVAHLYKAQHPSPLILPTHIDLAQDSIRRELVKHIGNEYNGVIASDIAGPSAKAPQLEAETGPDFAQYRVATGLATAIFFGSFSGAERKGVTLPWLRVAFLYPGVPPPLVGDAIKRLEEELWYLKESQGLYWFDNQPNINRIRVEFEEAVKPEQIQESLRGWVERTAGSEVRVSLWPRDPADVPDDRALKLVILAPEHPYPAADEFARSILDGPSGRFRVYRNTLLILAPSANELSPVQQKLRRLLALRAILDDKGLRGRLTEEDLRRVAGDRKDLEDGMPYEVRQAYRWLGRPQPQGIRWLDMGMPMAGEKRSLASQVLQHLKDQDILTDRISPAKLVEMAFGPEEQEKPLGDLRDAFLRYAHLPVLRSGEVVDVAVREGAVRGDLGLQLGDKLYFREQPPAGPLPDDARVVRKEVAQAETRPTPGTAPGPGTAGGPPPGGSRGVGVVAEREGPAPVEAGVAHVALRVRIPPERLSDFLRGVVLPLREQAEVTLEIHLQAQAKGGLIPQDLLDRTLRETLSQMGAEVTEAPWKGAG